MTDIAPVPAVPMPTASLGSSGIAVSRMALGSWRTFERISRDQGTAVLRAARESGITFLDDARYDDETGTAPMRTGYSEVVFGELFRAAGFAREQAVVANKLWWEFWPQESPAAEIRGSLGRMGLDYLDVIYTVPPPDGVPAEQAVELITGLIREGTARAWGTLFWPPALIEEAWQAAERAGVPGPAACQPAYSLVRRREVEDPRMQQVARDRSVAIVASYVLAGGVLTGKYDDDPQAGRAAGTLDEPRAAKAARAGRQLAGLARRTGRDPAQLAYAFALLNPSVTTVLFGATRPEQVRSNVAALALADALTPAERAELTAIGTDSGTDIGTDSTG